MHRVFESKIGNILVIGYAILTIGIPAFSLVCSASYCTPLVIVPILPWVLIVRDLGFQVPFASYPLFVLLNVCVLYLIGALIETGFRRIRGGAVAD